MSDTILFLGDSFTWGEGLELYTDTQKWKNERFIKNYWSELKHKQDYDGNLFRTRNRFPSLVGNYFNQKVIVNRDNGGNLHSFIRLAEESLYNPHNKITTVIIQMSCLDREMYHLTTQCKCDVCINSKYAPIFTCIHGILEKVYKAEKLTDTDTFILNFFENETCTKITDPLFFIKLDELRVKWYKETFLFFYKEYVSKWKSNNKRSIYFIDSWESLSSKSIHNIINKNEIIPLIGKDDKLYLKWSEWESTFSSNRIWSDFPNTGNDHPSLEQHKYIANSIINALKHNKQKLI